MSLLLCCIKMPDEEVLCHVLVVCVQRPDEEVLYYVLVVLCTNVR